MIQKMPNTTKEQMTEIDIILSIITLCFSSPSSTVERHRQTEVIIKEKSKDSIKVMGGKHSKNMELESRRVWAWDILTKKNLKQKLTRWMPLHIHQSSNSWRDCDNKKHKYICKYIHIFIYLVNSYVHCYKIKQKLCTIQTVINIVIISNFNTTLLLKNYSI